jgi:hypothetical protein
VIRTRIHVGVVLLVLVCLAASVPAGLADQTRSLSVETVQSDGERPAVERIDNETWLVPKEAVPVFITGTSSRPDGTGITLAVVHDDGRRRIGDAAVEDGRWNATVSFDDVPTGTHTVRATDGETVARVRIELVHVLLPPSTTPTATPVETSTRTEGSTVTPSESHSGTTTADPTTPATIGDTSADTSGFGVLAALAALALLVAVSRGCR